MILFKWVILFSSVLRLKLLYIFSRTCFFLCISKIFSNSFQACFQVADSAKHKKLIFQSPIWVNRTSSESWRDNAKHKICFFSLHVNSLEFSMINARGFCVCIRICWDLNMCVCVDFCEVAALTPRRHWWWWRILTTRRRRRPFERHGGRRRSMAASSSLSIHFCASLN